MMQLTYAASLCLIDVYPTAALVIDTVTDYVTPFFRMLRAKVHAMFYKFKD